jgi:hypothetical protein
MATHLLTEELARMKVGIRGRGMHTQKINLASFPCQELPL